MLRSAPRTIGGPVGPLGDVSPPSQPMEKLARSARSGSRCQARIGSSPEVRVWNGFDYTRLTHGRFWFSHLTSVVAGEGGRREQRSVLCGATHQRIQDLTSSRWN